VAATSTQVSSLGTFIAAASSPTGFLAKLNTAMATAGVAINVTSIAVAIAPKAATAPPTPAPTTPAPTSAPAPGTPSASPVASLPVASLPSLAIPKLSMMPNPDESAFGDGTGGSGGGRRSSVGVPGGLWDLLSKGNRRAYNSAGTAYTNADVEKEPLIPGKVESQLSMPKMVLCYMGLAKLTDPKSWNVTTMPTKAMVSKYDPAYCVSRKVNTTYEHIAFKAFNSNNGVWPPTTGSTDPIIKADAWVYNEDPITHTAAPIVRFEFTFKPGKSIEVRYYMTETTVEAREGAYQQNVGATCGTVSGSFSGAAFTGLTFYSLTTTMVNKTFSPNDATGSLQMTIKEGNGCTLERSGATGNAECIQANTANVTGCDLATAGGGGRRLLTPPPPPNVCDMKKAQVAVQFKKSAAVLAFNAQYGKIQTANESKNLAFKLGGNEAQVPAYCVDNNDVKEWVGRYSLFDASTGALWVGEGNQVSGYYFNTTDMDRTGRPYTYMTGIYNASMIIPGLFNPQPVAEISANNDGEYAMIRPEAETDIDGDGVIDGWQAVSQLPDGASFFLTDISGVRKQYVVRGMEVTTVPKQLASPFTACNALTLKTASPDPATLSCGALAANRAQASPLMPTKLTWLYGVWNGWPGIPDTTPPTINTYAPANSATGIALGANIVLTFSEPVQKGTGNIVLTPAGGGDTITIDVATSSVVSFSGAVLTINPAEDLVASKEYTVVIPNTAVKDADNVAFAGIAEPDYKFTTASA
jgi:hypothetical protein